MEHVQKCDAKLKEINTSIDGTINDYEPKSQALRKKMHDEYDPKKIIHTPGLNSYYLWLSNQGDSPHGGQKVLEDITNDQFGFKTTNVKATFIADKFNTRLKQFLKEELDVDRVSTNMPVITRWGTHLKMYQTLLKYRDILSLL